MLHVIFASEQQCDDIENVMENDDANQIVIENDDLEKISLDSEDIDAKERNIPVEVEIGDYTSIDTATDDVIENDKAVNLFTVVCTKASL